MPHYQRHKAHQKMPRHQEKADLIRQKSDRPRATLEVMGSRARSRSILKGSLHLQQKSEQFVMSIPWNRQRYVSGHFTRCPKPNGEGSKKGDENLEPHGEENAKRNILLKLNLRHGFWTWSQLVG